MVENNARSAPRQNNISENEKSEGSYSSNNLEKSYSKMLSDARGVGQDNDSRSLFEQVLKNESATGAIDMRGVFNVAVSELDDRSLVKKYVTADREGRKEVIKSLAADCTSSDDGIRAQAGDNLKKIMYFEALANLSSTQGKTDQQSKQQRSHALYVLAGQELSSGSKGEAAQVLAKLDASGDKSLSQEIVSVREHKVRERQAIEKFMTRNVEQLGAGHLEAAKKLMELHFQQAGEGNDRVADVAKLCRELVEVVQTDQKQQEKPITKDDAKPTAPRQGKTPEGTLIVPGESQESYEQYAVKAGVIFNNQGKEVGKLADDGTITMSGMSPFKIGKNDAYAFHGKGSDGQRLDLVSPADQKKFHGFIASADGKEVFTVTGGNMYDAKGKMLGKFSDSGTIETSEGGLFTTQKLGKFSTGAIVIGEENGKSRCFVASTSNSDGFIQIKDEKTGNFVRHEVKMGMLIDGRTGEQTGLVIPPTESADGNLKGGLIVTFDGDKPTATNFTDKQDMIFSLRLNNVSGAEASAMQGVTTGKDEIYNIGESIRRQKELRRLFTEAKNDITDSEKGFGAFNLKKVTGVNTAQKAEMDRKAAACERDIDELEKILKADKSAIAYVDSLKANSQAAKEALYGKSENGKTMDAPAVIEVPALTSAEITATVNGKLAIGNQIFTIKNGDLYAAGKENQPPTGKLLPGYIAEFNNGGRAVDLSKENRVAMRFTVSANGKNVELIGMGPAHMSELGYQQGGLVDAKSLTAAARALQEQANKGNKEYFANRPYLTGSIGNWMLGDHEALMQKYANQVGSRANNVDSVVQSLMHDAFDPDKASNRGFDVAHKELALLMHLTHAEVKMTEAVAQRGQKVQGDVRDAAAIAALTLATAGIGAGFALAAKGGHLAAIGVTSAYAVTGLELTACAAAGAGTRVAIDASPNFNWRRSASGGAMEGLTLGAQGKVLNKLNEIRTAATAAKQATAVTNQTFSSAVIGKGKELTTAAAQELVVSGATSVGLGAAHAQLRGENLSAVFDPQALTIATATNLLGRYTSARAGDLMNSKFVQGAMREVGKTSTASALVHAVTGAAVYAGSARAFSSTQEQRQTLFGEVSLAKTVSDVLDAGAMGGATGLALSGAMRAGEYSIKSLASQYSNVRKQLASSEKAESRTTEISRERLQSLVPDFDKTPAQPRSTESLWKGLQKAVEAANSPRRAQAPQERPVVREAELTPEQRRTNELDFQRRIDAGEFTSRKAPVDNKPITDPVEISKKVIDKHIHDLKNNRANAGAEPDTRRTELIKPEVYFDDSIGPRQLFTVATTAKVAINDSLKLVAKIGHGAAEDIANQSISIGPKQFGHTREVKAQLTLAKETQGDIDPSNMFVKTGPNRAEAIIGHVRNASQAMPETDYFATTKEIAGHRGMSRWMEQNEQRRAIQHEISKDYNKRSQEASEDPSKGLFLRRAPQEIAAATVAAKATQIKLESEISELTKAGQSTKQHQEALTKLQEFQNNLAKARQDAGYNPVFKAYFAELDAYMKKAFEN